jgi:hypothetical protein
MSEKKLTIHRNPVKAAPDFSLTKPTLVPVLFEEDSDRCP